MKPGFALDYVYRTWGGNGYPVLYARPVDKPPYSTVAEYENAEGEVAGDTAYRFAEYIQPDGTADGFFQLVVLRLVGDQFYLQWHANYHDERIICNHENLDATIAEVETFFKQLDDPNTPNPDVQKQLQALQNVRDQASALELRPTVEFKDDTVVVTVIFFTKWGGLVKATHTISGSFPHKVIDLEIEQLIEYQSGIMF